MTDRFEEAVRQAAQGLGTGAGGDLPGYHESWARGRRRRVVKQAGLACVSALALVVALGVNAGRFDDSRSVDVADVALESNAATSVPVQTPPPTTPPLATAPLPTVTPVSVAAAVPTSTPEATPPADEVPTSTAVPAEPTPTVVPPTSAPAATVTPQPTPTPIPEPTATPVPPTPEPTATALPSDAAANTTVRTPDPTVDEATPTPTPTVKTTGPANPEDLVDGPETPQTLPSVQSTADAVIVGEIIDGSAPCDTTGDTAPDSSCELFPEYPCAAAGDALPGYTAVDTTGDSSVDTCVAVVGTTCDFSGDGLADVSCVITSEVAPAEPVDE